MSNKLSIPKLLAAVTLVGALTFGFTFSSYKAINQYVDLFVLDLLDYLATWDINLTVEQFWILLAVLFFVAIMVVVFTSD